MIKVCLSLGFILSTITICAQDPIFSQYYASPIYLNPAMTALEQKTKLSFHHRNQWGNQAARFNTSLASFETAFDKKNALGVQLLHDVAGDNILTTTNLNISYRREYKVSHGLRVNGGIQAGLAQRHLNSDQLTFEDQLSLEGSNQISSKENLSNNQKVYPDFSAGIMLLTESFYGGFSIYHLNRAETSFYGEESKALQQKYTFHTGAKLTFDHDRSRHSYYSPNLIIQQQGESQFVSFGNYFKHKSITGGIWYRWKQAVTLCLGLEYKDFRIGYSSDINTASYATSFSHELSISFFVSGNKRTTSQYSREDLVFCPNF